MAVRGGVGREEGVGAGDESGSVGRPAEVCERAEGNGTEK